MKTCQAIVVGLGGMGSAVCAHLARRGVEVVGLEQFDLAHDRGSSHGETRIIRKAYFEHPDYVPLLHRAYPMWDELSREMGVELFVRCGLLLAGNPHKALITGARRSAIEHDLDIPVVPRDEWERRFGGFAPDEDMELLFEGDAGFLHVERCVRAHADLARRLGATLVLNTTVRSWVANAEGATVYTDGESYRAPLLILCAGPWTGPLLRELGLPLTVKRKVQLWLRTRSRWHGPQHHCPVFIVQTESGYFYGFPTLDGTSMKIAEHTGGEVVPDPSRVDRALSGADIERVAEFASAFLPGVHAEVLRHAVCLYTMTPDEHFILDRHPRHDNVFIAAGFSGHGFKFAPVVGSILADLAVNGRTDAAIGFLGLQRFAHAR